MRSPFAPDRRRPLVAGARRQPEGRSGRANPPMWRRWPPNSPSASQCRRLRGVALTYEGERDSSLLVWASGAWIERLVGVLVDNACKFAGRGGTVRVSVRRSATTSTSRSTTRAGHRRRRTALHLRPVPPIRWRNGGTGLGLAIADSVVRATGGTWSVGRSTLGVPGCRCGAARRRCADWRSGEIRIALTSSDAGRPGRPDHTRRVP